jgi:hypothetical protein
MPASVTASGNGMRKSATSLPNPEG